MKGLVHESELGALVAAMGQDDANVSMGRRQLKGLVYIVQGDGRLPDDTGIKYGSAVMRDLLAKCQFGPLCTSEVVFDELEWECLRESAYAAL
jgi:hypothetical protein